MVDPIESLPFETIVQIFSLLSTPDISISASTNENWRNIVLTDPVINKVIDLKDLRLSEDEIIRLVRRLFSISTHPDKRVERALHLNLDSFWQVFLDFFKVNEQPLNTPELLKEMSSKYWNLIEEISSSTQNQLGKLFVHVDRQMSLGNRNLSLYCLIIGTLENLSSSKESLINEVRFNIPFPISLEAKRTDQDGKTSKLFSVENVCDVDPYDFTEDCNSELCERILQDAVDLTAGGLVELALNMTKFAPRGLEADRSLLFEIEGSRETLKSLDLRFKSVRLLADLFKLVTNLPNLISLEFSLFSEQRIMWAFSPTPQQAPLFCLEYLHIWRWAAESTKLDWLVDWVGPELKEFTLYPSNVPTFAKFSTTVLCSILKTCSLLKRLKLGKMSLIDYPASDLIQVLPSLEELILDSLSLDGVHLFSRLSMPQLHTLRFGYSTAENERGFLKEEEESLACKHFGRILKNCRSSLQILELWNILKEDLLEDQEEGIMNLEKLKEIAISESDCIAIEFLSHFQLPLLRYLKIYSSSTQPHSLSEFLKSSSSCLLRVVLDELQFDLSMVNIFSSKERLVLPNLSYLEIVRSDPGLIDLFSNAVTGKLEHIKIVSSHLCGSQELPKSVSNLLKSNASTLVTLHLEVLCCSECDLELPFSNYGAGFEFPCLRELYLGLNSPPLLQFFFSECNLPKLSILWLEASKLPLYCIVNFIKEQSSLLTSLEVGTLSFGRDLTNWTVETERKVLFPKLATLIVRWCTRAEIVGFCQSLLGLPQALSMKEDTLFKA